MPEHFADCIYFSRLLSSEKCQLETTVFNSSRAVERMSQNVEELQWRIRNNYELPVEICSPSTHRPSQLLLERYLTVTGGFLSDD